MNIFEKLNNDLKKPTFASVATVLAIGIPIGILLAILFPWGG